MIGLRLWYLCSTAKHTLATLNSWNGDDNGKPMFLGVRARCCARSLSVSPKAKQIPCDLFRWEIVACIRLLAAMDDEEEEKAKYLWFCKSIPLIHVVFSHLSRVRDYLFCVWNCNNLPESKAAAVVLHIKNGKKSAKQKLQRIHIADTMRLAWLIRFGCGWVVAVSTTNCQWPIAVALLSFRFMRSVSGEE